MVQHIFPLLLTLVTLPALGSAAAGNGAATATPVSHMELCEEKERKAAIVDPEMLIQQIAGLIKNQHYDEVDIFDACEALEQHLTLPDLPVGHHVLDHALQIVIRKHKENIHTPLGKILCFLYVRNRKRVFMWLKRNMSKLFQGDKPHLHLWLPQERGTYCELLDLHDSYRERRQRVKTILSGSAGILPVDLANIVSAYAVVPGICADEFHEVDQATYDSKPPFVRQYIGLHRQDAEILQDAIAIAGINSLEGISEVLNHHCKKSALHIRFSHLTAEDFNRLKPFLLKRLYHDHKIKEILLVAYSTLHRVDLNGLSSIKILNLVGNELREIVGWEKLLPQLERLSLEANRLPAELVKKIEQQWIKLGKPRGNLRISAQQHETPEGWVVFLDEREPFTGTCYNPYELFLPSQAHQHSPASMSITVDAVCQETELKQSQEVPVGVVGHISRSLSTMPSESLDACYQRAQILLAQMRYPQPVGHYALYYAVANCMNSNPVTTAMLYAQAFPAYQRWMKDHNLPIEEGLTPPYVVGQLLQTGGVKPATVLAYLAEKSKSAAPQSSPTAS